MDDEKKIVIVGSGDTGDQVAEQIAAHDDLPIVSISDTEPEEIKRMNDMQNELAVAMITSYATKLNYGKPRGKKNTSKKKKRGKGKKTHRR